MLPARPHRFFFLGVCVSPPLSHSYSCCRCAVVSRFFVAVDAAVASEVYSPYAALWSLCWDGLNLWRYSDVFTLFSGGMGTLSRCVLCSVSLSSLPLWPGCGGVRGSAWMRTRAPLLSPFGPLCVRVFFPFCSPSRFPPFRCVAAVLVFSFARLLVCSSASWWRLRPPLDACGVA